MALTISDAGVTIRVRTVAKPKTMAVDSCVEGEALASIKNFFTGGYFYIHYSPPKLEALLKVRNLNPERTSLSQMAKSSIQFMLISMDDYLKRKFSWPSMADFSKP